MEAKESLVKLIRSMLEIKAPVPKDVLTDFLIGKESGDITQLGWDELENFGVGEAHEDEYWNNLIDAALEQGYLKIKSAKAETLIPTTEGKKFCRKPTSFVIEEDDEISDIQEDKGLDQLVKNALDEKLTAEQKASPKTKQQIKLIHAIDRKVALDDFAENESLGLDEVLDDVENLVNQGRTLDITYFTDEVLGHDCVSELLEYFQESPTDDLNLAMKEFGDVYNEEEVRLARVVFRVQKKAANTKSR